MIPDVRIYGRQDLPLNAAGLKDRMRWQYEISAVYRHT